RAGSRHTRLWLVAGEPGDPALLHRRCGLAVPGALRLAGRYRARDRPQPDPGPRALRRPAHPAIGGQLSPDPAPLEWRPATARPARPRRGAPFHAAEHAERFDLDGGRPGALFGRGGGRIAGRRGPGRGAARRLADRRHGPAAPGGGARRAPRERRRLGPKTGPGAPGAAIPRVGPHEQLAARFLSQVPPDVPVSASTTLLPHLSERPSIYLFPTLRDAEYVLIDASAPPAPVTLGDARARVQDLLE